MERSNPSDAPSNSAHVDGASAGIPQLIFPITPDMAHALPQPKEGGESTIYAPSPFWIARFLNISQPIVIKVTNWAVGDLECYALNLPVSLRCFGYSQAKPGTYGTRYYAKPCVLFLERGTKTALDVLNQFDFPRCVSHQARPVFIEMCLRVRDLHNLRRSHGDVKAENFVVRASDGRLALIDFGTVHRMADDGSIVLQRNIGTPNLRAPEVDLEVTPGVTRVQGVPVDVYALGITLYALLTRTYPDGPVTEASLALFGAALPPTARALILQMLHCDPTQRPTCAEILASPFCQGLDDLPAAPAASAAAAAVALDATSTATTTTMGAAASSAASSAHLEMRADEASSAEDRSGTALAMRLTVAEVSEDDDDFGVAATLGDALGASYLPA